jgi:hypothetical protein
MTWKVSKHQNLIESRHGSSTGRMDMVRVGRWGVPSKAPSCRSRGSEEVRRRGESGSGGRIPT